MILTRDLQTPIGYYAAGTRVQLLTNTADGYVVRLAPGWTITVTPDMLQKARPTTCTCVSCRRETLRPYYCPDCELIAVRMQQRRRAA